MPAEIAGGLRLRRAPSELTQTVEAVTQATNKPMPKKKKDVEREIAAWQAERQQRQLNKKLNEEKESR